MSEQHLDGLEVLGRPQRAPAGGVADGVEAEVDPRLRPLPAPLACQAVVGDRVALAANILSASLGAAPGLLCDEGEDP